ncbi:hypothetical protein MKX08_005748 [Trichoderma sp. CBMAI-0020]|nr:hypothetical protein MKX08_005748 [Trichoderma sp. CBMAI-0020]
MGIYANSQLLADSFAAKGYTTLIPDVFNGGAIPLNEFPTVELLIWLVKGFDGKSPHIKTLRELGSGIEAAFVAHPSFVEEGELAALNGPLSIAAAGTDSIFPASKRHKSEAILAKTGQPYQITLFSGVEHGFGIRGDPNVKIQKFAKEQAFDQAVAWFNEHLLKV